MPLQAGRHTRLEDPGAELLARGAELWGHYGRLVLGVVVAAAVIGAVTFLTLRSREAAEGRAAGMLAEANVLYWQGDYARSRDMAKQIAKQYPSSPSGIDAHRLAGDNAYWDGDFKGATDEYRAYLARVKTGELADAVRRSLAYALESDHKFVEAATAYEKLVGAFDRESSAEFLAAAGRCYRAAGQPAEAAKRLQRLVDEFGETSHAMPARVELAELSTAAH